MRLKLFKCVLLSGLVAVIICATGCGSFLARRIAQAPNSYPTWIAPTARVMLAFNAGFLTNFPRQYLDAGPPAVRLLYRVVEPADYNLRVTETNWLEHGKMQYTFSFHADLSGPTNRWTAAPRGTVVLLHGYGVAQFAMAPWALRLAQEGWRCVLVDLRGHGKSTGKRIFFGTRETTDLSQLLDHLDQNHQLAQPVAAVGESYGAVIALRWEGLDPRLRSVVAITPYAELANAILNIRRDYAAWLPKPLVLWGIKKLPTVLEVPAADLDTTTALMRHPVPALFIAGGGDEVTPVSEVEKLHALAAPGSKMIVVPAATHESLTYFFGDLSQPIISWLNGKQ